MIKLTRQSFDRGRASKLEETRCLCSKCKNIDSWKSGRCSACGTHEVADHLCTRCNEILVASSIEYTALGKNNTKITETYPADKCPKCNHIFIWSMFPNEPDEVAALVPSGFRILPEVGISYDKFLEIFVTGGNLWEGIPEIIRKSRGIELRFGPQSKLFERVLTHITDYDTSDYGHDQSPTLRIRPSPPYSQEQRGIIHVLLSRLRIELQTPLLFWSVHFGKNFGEDQERTIHKLITLVQKWHADSDRKALMLANAACNNDPPGSFINTYRLIELILDRLIDTDIKKKRAIESITDEDFLLIAKSYNADLKTKLRKRVDPVITACEDILKDIWRVLQPERGFNSIEVFAEIVKFRNSNVHGAQQNNSDHLLPWAVPPFDFVIERLQAIMCKILERELK